MALIASTTWNGGPISDGSPSPAINTTGATLLIVLNSSANAASTITDSKGNTWTNLTTNDLTFSNFGRLSYVQNPTVGTGHTASATNNKQASVFAAFDGTLTSGVFDQQNAGGHSSGLTTGVGSITPAQAANLMIAGLIGLPGTSESIDSGYTLITGTRYVNNDHQGCFLAYLIQATATAQNPTFTVGANGQQIGGVSASFNLAGGGGGTKAMPPFGRQFRPQFYSRKRVV